jgi:outer membrane protein OmpA-like peptidoglycan-associated protein
MISSLQHRNARAIGARLFAAMTFAAVLHVTPVNAQTSEFNDPVDAHPLNIPLSPMRNTQFNAEEDTSPAAPAAPSPQKAEQNPHATPAPAMLRILFSPTEAALDDQAMAELDKFATTFKAQGGRVTLRGYAGEPGSTGSNERRLSLRRVLAVREQLLTQGIAQERLTVQALGGVKDAGNPDRVDILKSGR